MPTIVHGFDWPDRVVIGTVGQPGSRSFYLQARAGRRVTSVALEKEQSALLAEKIDEVLEELRSLEGNPLNIPETTPAELVDDDPLEQPVEPEFRTGTMSLGWDPTVTQIILEAFPVDDSDDDETDDVEKEPTEVLRVRMPVGTARAFVERTRAIVGAGRQ